MEEQYRGSSHGGQHRRHIPRTQLPMRHRSAGGPGRTARLCFAPLFQKPVPRCLEAALPYQQARVPRRKQDQRHQRKKPRKTLNPAEQHQRTQSQNPAPEHHPAAVFIRANELSLEEFQYGLRSGSDIRRVRIGHKRD